MVMMTTTNDVALTGAEIEAMLHTGKLVSLSSAMQYAAARAAIAWDCTAEEAPVSFRPTQLDATVRPGAR